MKAFVLVIDICPQGDHMVGIVPREWIWCTLCVKESDERGNNICKALRNGTKHYINPDYYYIIMKVLKF